MLQFFVFAKDAVEEGLQQHSRFLLQHGGVKNLQILTEPLLRCLHALKAQVHQAEEHCRLNIISTAGFCQRIACNFRIIVDPGGDGDHGIGEPIA